MASTSVSKAEKSYIETSLLSTPPLRADGRTLQDFRAVALETGIAPLANGSARLNIGLHDWDGGTEVLAAVKLEVENIQDGEGVEGGRFVCVVSCSPAAYPYLSTGALDDLQHDMTTIMHQTLSHPSLRPPNLGILRGKKSWLLNLDIVVLADSGNVYDALFMAARAALWDTKVPRTESVEYKARKGCPPVMAGSAAETGDIDLETSPSSFDTRQIQNSADFELPDYWDEGEVLGGREKWPICITLNLVPPICYLDATLPEEASTCLRLLLVFSFPLLTTPELQAIRLLGPGEVKLAQMKGFIKDGEQYARELFTALNVRLKDEDVRRNQIAVAVALCR